MCRAAPPVESRRGLEQRRHSVLLALSQDDNNDLSESYVCEREAFSTLDLFS